MNKFLKTLSAFVLVAMMAMLVGCTQEPAAPQRIAVPTPTPEQIGMKAKADISAIAKATVEKYAMRKPEACDPATSAPPELLNSKSYQDFPLTGPGIYKSSCRDAIRSAIAAEKQKAATAVANAKARDQKLAAKKAAEDKRLAEAKKAKPKHNGTRKVAGA